MQSLSKEQINRKIAFLASLSLLFSYIELFFPRIIPFFRLGLGNIVILLAFSLPFPYFLLLNLIRIFSGAMLQGTLFSPFIIISLAQGFASAILMYGLSKISVIQTKTKKIELLSLYGISMSGSAVSAIIQIFLSSLYLGKGTQALLAPMLLFSLISGIITAFFATQLKIPQLYPEIIISSENNNIEKKEDSNLQKIFTGILILACAGMIIYIKNIVYILCLVVLALVFQLVCHRKIKILPYFSLWIFVILCSIFTPKGQVLFKIFQISITKDSLLDAVVKAGKLSFLMSISQSASSLKPSSNSTSLISLTLCYFSGLSEFYRNSKGNFFQKFQNTVSATELHLNQQNRKGITLTKAIIFTLVVSAFLSVQFLPFQ